MFTNKQVRATGASWMRGFAASSAVAISLGWAATSQAQAIFSFETGLEGWTAANATLSQSTFGATDGTQALLIGGISGGFLNDVGTANNFGPNTVGREAAYSAFGVAAEQIALGNTPMLEFDFKVDLTAATGLPAFGQLALFLQSSGGYVQYGTGELLGGNFSAGFPTLDPKAVADGVTLTNTAPDQYHVAIPIGAGKSLTLQAPSAGNTFYNIGFKANGGQTGTVAYGIDNIRFTGVPTFTTTTLFSWETPDNPGTPGVNEQFEGWVTTNEVPSPPPGVVLQPGHAQSIVSTGATDGTSAYQIDRTSLPTGFTWGSQYGLSGVGNPTAQARIDQLIPLINGADRIAFDVTYEDQFPISPTFTTFTVHFADGSGEFYQGSTANIQINGAVPGSKTTLEIPISAFVDATEGSTKTLVNDGLGAGSTFLEIGLATNTDGGAIYQIDNFRVITQDSEGGLQADFNNDTFVNGDDLTIWKAAFGTTVNGDADDDGDSDGNDFLIWQREFGAGAPAQVAAAAVPEPGSVALALFASLGLLWRTRR